MIKQHLQNDFSYVNLKQRCLLSALLIKYYIILGKFYHSFQGYFWISRKSMCLRASRKIPVVQCPSEHWTVFINDPLSGKTGLQWPLAAHWC